MVCDVCQIMGRAGTCLKRWLLGARERCSVSGARTFAPE